MRSHHVSWKCLPVHITYKILQDLLLSRSGRQVRIQHLDGAAEGGDSRPARAQAKRRRRTLEPSPGGALDRRGASAQCRRGLVREEQRML